MEPKLYRRRRPALSCVECRRRKIKCDRNEPCGHCVATKGRCTYKVHPTYHQSVSDHSPSLISKPSTNEALSSATDGRSTPTSHAIGRLDNLHAAESPIVVGSSGSMPSSESQYNNIDAVNGSSSVAPDILKSQQRLQKLEISSPSSSNGTSSKAGKEKLVLQAQLKDGQITLDKPRVLRWRHWEGTDHEFSAIMNFWTKYCDNEKTASTQPDEASTIAIDIRDLVLKCKSLARTIKLNRPSRFLMSSGFKPEPPSRELADEMVDLYLHAFESTYRILHVPTFWIEYRNYWINPGYCPTNLTLKILLVVAIGSSLKQFEDRENGLISTIRQWVYIAETWLSGPLEKDRLDIHGIQIHCLSILARQVLSIGGDLLWMSMGSLVHKAMQTGLHRDPDHLPKMSVLQAEVRRRLWATILEMIVQSSLDAGMPPRISIDEYDTKPPCNVNDDEMNESTTVLQSISLGAYTTTSMQLILLNALPVRLRVVHLLSGLHSELSYPDVLSLSSEITDACRKCSEFIKSGGKSSMTPFHRNLLDYMLRRFLLPLHRPFASQAREVPLFSYSLKVGLDAAMATMSPEPDENYSNLRIVGGSIFKEGFRSAMTAIGLELLAQVESQRLDGTLHRQSPYRQLLKQAINDLIELSIARMKHGETNVKSHMFLSMVLAQVEATEEDVSIEMKIAERMKESLTIGYDILRSQVESSPVLCEGDGGLSTLFDGSEGLGMDLDMDFLLPEINFF